MSASGTAAGGRRGCAASSSSRRRRATPSLRGSRATGSPPRTPRGKRERARAWRSGRRRSWRAGLDAGRLEARPRSSPSLSLTTPAEAVYDRAMLDPGRTVSDLRELRELTGDANGAQRVAWTDTWQQAREWLRGKLDETGAIESFDAAGNQWFTLPGEAERALLIGGHIDSVPNGGWLDGALNVMAGAEVLRRLASEGKPKLTVRLVNWADEEGARFGRSLFGSSAAADSMADQDELRERHDAEGISLPDAISRFDVDLDTALDARSELENAATYLELHIEQGPVLESLDLPLGVVLGTFGVERHQVTFRGQAAHAGSTPMDKRRDALAGAARL